MKKNKTLMELLAGICFFGVIIQVLCLLALEKNFYHAIGLWTGIAIACFIAIHLKRSIEDSLDLGPEGAEKHARKSYVVRTVVTLLVAGIVVYFNLGNPITLVIGIFTLKLAAYIQPHTHKLFERFAGQKRKK